MVDKNIDIKKLMSTANKMHEGLESIQKAMLSAEFEGISDNQAVRITLNGRHKVVAVSLDESATQASKADLESWIAQAIDLATTQVDMQSREKIMQMTNPFDETPQSED